MNAQQYEELAASCDALLRSSATSLGRIALPLLHLISEHPSLLAAYQPLFAPQAGLQQSANPSPSVAAPAGAGVIARRAVRALRRAASHRPRPAAELRARSVDVLIVSHLNHPTQLQEEADFYFGDLQRLLRARGATSVLALANHLPATLMPVLPDPESAPAMRILMPNSLPLAAEVRVWTRAAAAGRALLGEAQRAHPALHKQLARLAGRQALSGHAVRNLRLHHVIASLCLQLAPRIVITTYEGDASERLIWHAARQAPRRPLCVGYQHTSLRAHAHAIRRRVNAPGLACDPDVVLTLGEITEAALGASAALHPVKLITYGTHRRPPAVASADASDRDSVCLVLPDGDPSECDILFRFAIECARQMPGVTFLLRPHPASRLDAGALRAMSGAEMPANVALSTQGALAEHCARARYCLYRGSSAVIEAVLAGVKPFYLARPHELSFDPLYQLGEWRETVTLPAEFAARVAAATPASSEAAERARQFCDRYLSPVRPVALDSLLELAAGRAP
jgi:hypothetical protein